MQSSHPRTISNWLFFIAAIIFGMVVIGGITRLTESGLSITEWKPVTGAIPPLNAADWQAAFDAYKHSSQYVLMNQGMDLAAFKHIYFWEYLHRLLGRLLGVAFALPLLWFLIKRAIPRGFMGRLILLFLLGGAQGGVGWLMVKSGLTNRINVEPAMLAAHLLMALLLFSLLIWTALDLRREGKSRLTGLGAITLAAVFGQVFFGAITAGLRAGQVSNTWPLMNGHFVPEGIISHGSLWMTLTSDPFLIHFLHRWWAWAAVGLLILLARAVKRAGARPASIAIHSSFGIQILLGIATVLSGVTLWVAALHQAVGALLVASTVWGAHALGQRRSS